MDDHLYVQSKSQKYIELDAFWVNDTEVVSNARKNTFPRSDLDPGIVLPKRRHRHYGNIFEQYCITIKPKRCRSNSLSDLHTSTNDFNIFKHNSKLTNSFPKDFICGSFGDTNRKPLSHLSYMSGLGKKLKNKSKMPPEMYTSKFGTEYVHNIYQDTDVNFSSEPDDSSSYTVDQMSNIQTAFPFKSTPSGNLKVQSNQVVFQSSTVGVLLADPSHAKVKVKFEENAADEPDNIRNFSEETDSDTQLQYDPHENKFDNVKGKNAIYDRNFKKHKSPERDRNVDKEKDLGSLGYVLAEPVDWTRVQLPKKQDLFQEFYRRIRNHVNTDTVVHIGNEEFHCHLVVLQIYSSYFNSNHDREIELPIENVSPEAFQTIYDWMIFSGPESNKLLKRDNVLDIFSAAQYLSIKDLEDQCWSFIVNDNLFTEDSAFALFREARIKSMTPVMDLMIPRVMRFFLPLVASKDFLELELEEVTTFLKSNYICVTSEIEVLMAGVRWLYADWVSRHRYAIDIMRCVRFGLISPWQLVDIKRNPDNAEILEIVNEAEVQQMVDDGLAYVIIKYWYGNNSKNYYHWIDVLGLTEPAERNWVGEEKNHVTYKDFLQYLEDFLMPKDQLYQHMSMMQPLRRSDDVPGNNLRAMDNEKMETRRRNIDFPLPATLKSLGADKEKFPTMSDFFETRRQAHEGIQSNSPIRSPTQKDSPKVIPKLTERRSPDIDRQKQFKDQQKLQLEQQQQSVQTRQQHIHQIQMCTVHQNPEATIQRSIQMSNPPTDSREEIISDSGNSTVSADTSITDKNRYAFSKHSERRHSTAASYLAAATAALGCSRRVSVQSPSSPVDHPQKTTNVLRTELSSHPPTEASQNNFQTPQISLFNQSKEHLAGINMNKLSTSILGPSNKNYITGESLFNWERETVLVFGGIDPHNPYASGRNTGRNIYRYDPVTNVWDYVGDLPEPRHHHSVAFLRGRVYLVGGADPRDDDIRGKSVVVSTVWSYEPVTRSWYSESGLAIPRKNFGLVVHRLALYAIGGQDKKGRVLRSVERFDPKTGSWMEVRSMSVARMAVASVKYRDYIWVAGGMTGEKKKPVSKIVECYNSKTNEWTVIHCLRFPRCFATLFSMNDKLYIVGGAGKKSEKDKTASSVAAIDCWDWKNRQWKLETEMSIPRHGHALAYLGTQLIIIGGMTTIYMRALNNVESFCCERSAWIRGVATLPSPLSGHGAVTLPPASLM